MPQLLSKEEALELLSQEGDAGGCLVCRINRDNPYIITENAHCKVMLSQYPRFWGHTLVCLKRHAERHTELSDEENTALYRAAHHTAKTLEKLLLPSRCYIASIGSEEQRLNTCPHLHVHVIPVPDSRLKPSDVFTWENGSLRGSEKEWETLYHSIKPGFPAV